jgi:hypothetical protein
MTDDERVRKLSDHVKGLWFQIPTRAETSIVIARAIIANAKAHIAALIEAGVPVKDIMDALMEAKAISQVEDMWNADGTETFTYYELKNPKSHVHEGYATAFYPDKDTVLLHCDCGEGHEVPNSTPIEWPDDE